jgi:hypothetical protein
MSGFCLGERGLGRGQKLTRAGGPNAHVRFISAFPACPPAKSAAAGRAGGRALPYHVCVPRIKPGGQFQGGFCHLRRRQNLGQKMLLYSYYMPKRGKDERKKVLDYAFVTQCYSFLSPTKLSFMLILCRKENWLKRAWS